MNSARKFPGDFANFNRKFPGFPGEKITPVDFQEC